jgi:hypothetical protein
MVQGHRIKEKVEIGKFLEQIQEYEKGDVEITAHTFKHFSEKQRKIYNDLLIKDLLFNNEPIFVGIQYNGLWALFYKYENDIFRIIVEIQAAKLYIVTFYIIDELQIPKI